MPILVSQHTPRFLWTIRATYYSPQLQQAIRNTAGVQWDPLLRRGIGYADGIDAVCRKLEASGLRIVRGDLPTGPAKQSLVPASYTGLREYQKTALDFLMANGPSGCLLADEMGVGKSAPALRAAKAFRQKTVIVCLSFARGVWMGPHDDLYPSQIEKFWPEVYDGKVVQLEGVSGHLPFETSCACGEKLELEAFIGGVRSSLPLPKKALLEWKREHASHQPPVAIDPSAQVAVVHYDILHAWVDALLAWGAKTVIIDEIHACQSERSRRTQAVTRLAHACAVRIGLSGTPMTNRPRDLFPIINILCPNRMGLDFFPFGREFCNGHKVEIDMRAD